MCCAGVAHVTRRRNPSPTTAQPDCNKQEGAQQLTGSNHSDPARTKTTRWRQHTGNITRKLSCQHLQQMLGSKQCSTAGGLHCCCCYCYTDANPPLHMV